MKKIFIANLPFHVTAAQTKQLFELFGTVQYAKIMTELSTGKSRGYGFLEMLNDDAANRAITALNGTEIDGRRISVQLSSQGPENNVHKRPRKQVSRVAH
jgi:RNA recognition motif-containing protein